MSLVPTAFLFRYSLSVQRVDRLPRSKAPLVKLPEECRVPLPSSLDPGLEFAAVSLAWNPQGFAVEVQVTGKKKPPRCQPASLQTSDVTRIWIDTRNTQNMHRASRFCQHFLACPVGEGRAGTAPLVRQLPVPRAREDAPMIDPESILAESEISKTGYRLGIWFPAESLHGYDPTSQGRLGFYMAVRDPEQGEQTLAVGDEFPWEADPSLWVALELLDR